MTLLANTIYGVFAHEISLSTEADGRAESSDTGDVPQTLPETLIYV